MLIMYVMFVISGLLGSAIAWDDLNKPRAKKEEQ